MICGGNMRIRWHDGSSEIVNYLEVKQLLEREACKIKQIVCSKNGNLRLRVDYHNGQVIWIENIGKNLFQSLCFVPKSIKLVNCKHKKQNGNNKMC
jgi:hypothetical protein